MLLKRIKTGDTPNATPHQIIEVNIVRRNSCAAASSRHNCFQIIYLFCSIHFQDKVETQTENKTMNDTKPLTESQAPQNNEKSPSVATTGENSSTHIIKTDPRYRNPFKFGWRREVVFRANMQNVKSDNKGEVYYHSPSGKKLRTKNEIMTELRVLKDQNLDIGDFTFAKESVGMPSEQEIVRSAKIQTPSQKRQSTAIPEPIQPPEILGKRVPKPKMPKGASPPPPSTANKSRVSAIHTFVFLLRTKKKHTHTIWFNIS